MIPYLIVLIIIGRPLYFLEMVLGQFSSSGSVEVWNVAPVARGFKYDETRELSIRMQILSILIFQELGTAKRWQGK